MMYKMFDDRKSLAKAMYGFALGYLRHLRAFHFDKEANLSEKYYVFCSLLIEDPYVSLTKMSAVKHAYEIASDRL